MEEKEKISQQMNERIQNAIRAVINQQMAEKNPPETLETFERLQDEGFSEDEAYSLIGQIVSMEVAEEIGGAGTINIERFVVGLEALPEPFTKPRVTDDID